MRPEILSKQVKLEMNENLQKIMAQVKIQESMQLAEKQMIKQKDQGMDLGL